VRTKTFLQLTVAVLVGDLLLTASAFCLRSQERQAYMTVAENRLAPLPYIKFCLRKPWRCAPSDQVSQIALDDVHRTELERIHSDVNREIVPLIHPLNISNLPWDDEASAGHCDDYALAKRSRLLDRGYPSSALLLAVAIVRDGSHHLVLVVVTDRGDYVLDNLQSRIVRWDELPYRWVMRSMPRNPQHWQAILPPPASPEADKLVDRRSSDLTRSCG
jgi:predicted transglutaminase-like cysteine proteinase